MSKDYLEKIKSILPEGFSVKETPLIIDTKTFKPYRRFILKHIDGFSHKLNYKLNPEATMDEMVLLTNEEWEQRENDIINLIVEECINIIKDKGIE